MIPSDAIQHAAGSEGLPIFNVPNDERRLPPLDASRFGPRLASLGVGFTAPLSDTVRTWCLIYEEILRRLFTECAVYRQMLRVTDAGVELNAIDSLSSTLIAEFLAAPTPAGLRALAADIRVYRGSPDVITLIICRNLGIPARRVVTDEEFRAHRPDRIAELREPAPMPTRESRRRFAATRRTYQVILETSPPHCLDNQASAPTPDAVRAALAGKNAGKYETAGLLRRLGYLTPPALLLENARGLGETARFPAVMLKPDGDGNRVGVVGPVDPRDGARLRTCYERCKTQISMGPELVLAQEYMRGRLFRINVNHGAVTFVAESVRRDVIGDGTSSIRDLAAPSSGLGYGRSASDEYVRNALAGSGWGLDDVPPAGEVVALSLDGNEGGRFLDVTDEFPETLKEQALTLARDLGRAALGLDVVLDAAGTMWIIDVNPDPALDFFDTPARAYQTIEHMIKRLAGSGGRTAAERPTMIGAMPHLLGSDAATGPVLSSAAAAYAMIHLLATEDRLTDEELNRAEEGVGDYIRNDGVVLQENESDKYALTDGVRIDCENRVHLCKAACCALAFPLSRQDVAEGVVRWNPQRPYENARGSDGYCVHLLTEQPRRCSIYAQRPAPCRMYDCRRNASIWQDFERKIPSPDLPALLARRRRHGMRGQR